MSRHAFRSSILPQIQLTDGAKMPAIFAVQIRWLLLLGLLLAITIGCEHAPADSSEKEAHAHVVVQARPAVLRQITTTVTGFGQCEALLDHLASLTPAVEGHVHAILVQPGDEVKAGQPLVELDPTVARADLAEKTAAHDTLVASSALLKSLPREEEQRASQLAIEQAKVAVERAKALADNLTKLRARNETSETALVDAQQALAHARLQQQSSEALYKVQMIGPRPEAVAEAEAKIKAADEAVALSKAHLDLHTIRAPFDGVLDNLACHPGQTIAVGAPIGEVVDSHQVYAMVWLPARSARLVRAGQKTHVRQSDSNAHKPGEARKDSESQVDGEAASGDREAADASSRNEGEIVGKVVSIGRIVDAQTGNLPVRILVDNQAGQLAIGQTLEVVITVAEDADVLAVPAHAVFDLGEGPIVCVVRDHASHQLQVETGATQDGWTPISGGDLKPGDLVITKGGFNLPDDTEVTIEGDEPASSEAAEST